MSLGSRDGAGAADARVSSELGNDRGPLEPRRRPLQERARLTVAAIIEAAGLLLVERGYAKVSTNLIAKRAGVSVGSLYQYFPNKESIYTAILDRHTAEMRALSEKALVTTADASVTFPVALHRVLESMVDVRRRDDEIMRALEAQLRQVIPERSKSHEEDDDLVDRIADVIAIRPDCHSDQPLVAARLVLVCCHGVTFWLLHRAARGVDAAAYLDQTVQMCELAVGYDPCRAHERRPPGDDPGSKEQAAPGST